MSGLGPVQDVVSVDLYGAQPAGSRLQQGREGRPQPAVPRHPSVERAGEEASMIPPRNCACTRFMSLPLEPLLRSPIAPSNLFYRNGIYL